jgi:hypothetical protein
VPELDFMIIAEYVRTENGVLHMIGGGFDTIIARSMPATRNIGVGLSLKLLPGEAAEHHTLRLIFHGAGNIRITEIGADLPAHSGGSDVSPGREVSVVTALNMSLPLPAYGDYSLELFIDSTRKKEIPVYVVPPTGRQSDPARPLLTGSA